MEKEEFEGCLDSPSTSSVLFNLILGRRSPIEIAKHVGDTPPAIIKHLWKLRKEGYVTLAEKSGKFQYYSINWDRLVFAGVGLMVDLATAMVLASIRDDVEKYNLLDNVRFKLSKNEHFKTFFKLFMEEEARKRDTEDVYLITTETFKDAITKFEKYLPQVFPHIIIDQEEPGKVEFLKLLKVVYEAISEAQDYESTTIKKALSKMGLLKT